MKSRVRRFSTKVERLAQVDRDFLRLNGIEGIILDLDNTIVSEDDVYLSPYAEDWIKQALRERIKLFILSNGKRIHRVEYWSKRLKVPAISPAKKPFLSSFKKALHYMKLEPHQIIVIGDGFHTDILGAYLLGSSCIQVSSLPHPLRWWEKVVGHWVQIPYRNINELWLLNGDFSEKHNF